MNRSDAVNVQTFLNEHPFSPFQWLVFAMCFVIVLLDGFDTAAIGFIAPSLLAEWGITKPALAPVLSAALFGLACGALASGPLSDRLGRRSMLLGSVLLLGGIAPLVLFVLLLIRMPESVRYMVANNQPVARIRAALGRVSSTAADAEAFTMTETAPATGGKGAAVVLSRAYIVGSVMLWI